MSMKIFDFHLHPGYDFHDNDTDPAHFVAILKADGLCGCAGSFINRDMNRRPAAEFAWRIPQLNRQVWEFQSTCPGFFVPGIHIHPDFPELSCKEMEAHKAKGGILLGELVSYMMDYRYDHPNLPELLGYAQSLGLVASIHPAGDMALNRAFLAAAPGMDVVLAHLGGMPNHCLYEDMIALMRENEHVYVDLSAYGNKHPGMLRDAVNRVGSERILYGTDFPGSLNEAMQKRYIDYVLCENLTTGETENIFYNNAARLLRLPSGE